MSAGALVLAACGGGGGSPEAPVVTGLVFATVSAGGRHTCGTTPSGAARCWGDNSSGQLGDGTATSRTTPVAVSGGVSFSTVSAGASHSCAATAGGAAYCWGDNASGQLGIATLANSATPVPVAGGLSFAAVSAGSLHTCGRAINGVAYCWGSNSSGQLGNGTTASSTTPVAVSGGLSFATVSAGASHSCGVTAGGDAYCWGDNSSGQLGNATTTRSTVPVAVLGGLASPFPVAPGNFATVGAGSLHSCAVTIDGDAYCWGNNSSGQLGVSTMGGSSIPVAVVFGSGLEEFGVLSVGAFHNCGSVNVLVNNGRCWGSNARGQLGDGTTTNSARPLAVSGGLQFSPVSAGASHTCGVTVGGVAYCWGENSSGQLGTGTTISSAVPVQVAQ